MKTTFAKSLLFKKTGYTLAGALLVGAVMFAASPTASAHYGNYYDSRMYDSRMIPGGVYTAQNGVPPAVFGHTYTNDHVSWWVNEEYNLKYLVVDFDATGVPFEMHHDTGYWYNGEFYCLHHQYFVYTGDNSFHTYYYYVR